MTRKRIYAVFLPSVLLIIGGITLTGNVYADHDRRDRHKSFYVDHESIQRHHDRHRDFYRHHYRYHYPQHSIHYGYSRYRFCRHYDHD